MEIRKLIRFNEWWKNKEVPRELLKEHKRSLYHEIRKYLSDRQILTIVGLRRVGKTTLMYQLIQDLLKNQEAENILYFSFDEQDLGIEEVLETYRENILKTTWRKAGRTYVFLDEIQKVDDWQNKIKTYYDLYPNIKFVCSGSASLFIERKSKESLAGRVFDFHLSPLTFKEYLSFKEIAFPREHDLFDNPEKIYEDYHLHAEKMETLLMEFIYRGGFPELVEEQDSEKRRMYVRNSVVDRIVYADIPKTFGIEDPQVLITILEIIANSPGFMVNYRNLAQDLGKNRVTISQYFKYLEKSFLIKMISNYTGSPLASARKLKKAYLKDIGIASILLEKEMNDRILGKLVENLIVIELDPTFFWRKYHEVDIVLTKKEETIPIEVKYRRKVGKNDLKGLLSFCKKFGLEKAIVVTKDIFKKQEIEDKEILFVPAWLFLLSSS